MRNTFEISADIKQKMSISEPMVTQNDDITFIVSVFDNGSPFSLTEATTASLANTRMDGTTVVTLGTIIDNNKIQFDLGTNETAVLGRVLATVQIYDADERVSTIAFTYRVVKDPTGSGYVPTKNEQTLIEVVLNDGPLVIQQAQDAAAYAKSQGDYAKQVGDENKTRWLTAVNTYADIATTYPNPQLGDTVQTIDDSKIYRWDGTQWVWAQQYNANAITDVQNKIGILSNKRLKSIGSIAEFTSGDGVSDDTQAFIQAINTYKTVLIPPPAVEYRITSLVFTDMNGVKLIGIGDPIIVGTDLNKVMITFRNCTNVTVKGLKIGYKTTPTVRNNSVRPIVFDTCSEIKVQDNEIFNSPSTGIFTSFCSNGVIEKNQVHDTLADGIYNQTSIKNMKVLNNDVWNVGDDAISFMTYKNNDLSSYGEAGQTVGGKTDPIYISYRPVIVGNTIKNSKARGIMVSGTKGAIIANNTIRNTSKYGIAIHWEPDGTPSNVNENYDFQCSNNTIIDAGWYGNDENQEYHGIYIAPYNTGGTVIGNHIENPRLHGILCRGNANIKANTILYPGGNGLYVGEWLYGVTKSFGDIISNTIIGSLKEAVIIAPSDGWNIKGNIIKNCVDPSNVGAVNSVIFTNAANNFVIQDNLIIETRETQTVPVAVLVQNGSGIVERTRIKSTSGFTNGELQLSSAAINNIREDFGSAPPTSGTYKVGDRRWNTNPTAGGYIGWVCVAAGSPGTWKGFGAIQS